MKRRLQEFYQRLKLSSWLPLFIFLGAFLILGKASFFGSFIDEHENMVAGWLLSKGWIPYRDFFFHHAPLPFFLSLLAFPWGQTSWWLFRFIVLLFYGFSVGVVFKKTDQRLHFPASLSFLALAVAAPSLNLQMLLADTFFLIAVWLLSFLFLSYFLFKTPKLKTVIRYFLVTSFIAIWSTIAAFFWFFLVGLGLLILGLHEEGWQRFWKKYAKLGAISIGLQSVFPLYFLFSGGWHDFWWSVFSYNQHFYFPLRLAKTQAELQWGILYAAYARFWQMVIKEVSFIFEHFWIFVLTAKSIGQNIFQTPGEILLQQFQVLLLTPLDLLTVRVETVTALLFVLVTMVFLLQKRFWELAAVFLILPTLYIRNNEVFHFAVLPVFLLILLGVFSLTSEKRKMFLGSLLGLGLLFWGWKFVPEYLEFSNNAFPIISQQKQQVSKKIKDISTEGQTLHVVGGGTAYYLLSDRVPASQQLYYFPWFEPVSAMKEKVYQPVVKRSADLILVEEQENIQAGQYFDLEIVERVKNTYTEGDKDWGIYRR